MTNQHPITPPPELMKQWQHEADFQFKPTYKYVAARAAQWGADQELEACVDWLAEDYLAADLRAARRPKPPSLAEEALKRAAMLEELARSCGHDPDGILRLALERLQELEGGND